MKITKTPILWTVLYWSLAAHGENVPSGSAERLESVVVSATDEPPVSITRIEGRQIQDAQALVNLSESLVRVPGLNIQNRQNFAQDLQVSLRGFGARATFGVRGVRLFTDGIPATAPDGQGQISHFDLGSAGHIEVLRGPFSSLYGNASGGVIALYTETPPPLLLGAALNGGSDGALRAGVKAGGRTQRGDYLIDLARFRTDGYREHSAAERDNGNARIGVRLGDAAQLSVVLNGVHVEAQDPLGLDRRQFEESPRSVTAGALQFDTRKEVRQSQAGALYALDLGANRFNAMLYGGQRDTRQFLATPASAQQAAAHAGGVVDLVRGYQGGDVRWTRRSRDAHWRLTAGLGYDSLRERRRGYENFVGTITGIQGALRRNELNTVAAFEQYAQLEWEPGPSWSLLAGIRHSEVKFRSRDRYITAGNGDDSGEKTYAAGTPAAGITFRGGEFWRLHAAYGRGFETPTGNELAYRSTGTQTGLNLGLRAALSDQYEAGVKYARSGTALELTGFEIDTRRELAVLANSAGRSVYQNIGATRRRGVELSATAALRNGFAAGLAYTRIDARYRTGFTGCSGSPCTLGNVPAGNRIPGVPAQSLFAELTWEHSPAGLTLGAEVRATDRVFADDFNREHAPAYALLGLHAQLEQRTARWRLQQFVRIDNLAERRYAGSVIVNESNQRYYEPAPGRSYLLGIRAEYRPAR